ncbi:hypothetical protein SAMD00019534_064790 [Acytostelium subglobosum LB1]|uniref:hypothetical protein n=1 Tax=Acytostelium subglobosum LB1 TaxID=1410327 RepID=UPI000644A9E4|nr:hypothetical protein SAMD00019534_064790 [Acytostelium subglobosum LB1]GAM23304.1 hypothetical protein SAMD00019534_064790 [Acytostelium subglobosum LB1]|eukprot:XP_012753753.1 hypothetical protein SAMD00019534_064790 [Acytostelium subglobosum LB1]
MKALPFIAGALFSVGWFLWIDGHVYENVRNNRDHDQFGPSIQWLFYLPGIFATVGLVMANIVNLESLSSFSFADEGSATKIRVWLFLSFAINFGCIAAAIWIMVANFMPPHNKNSDAQYPGIALTVQNVLIFISSLILVYSKSRQEEEQY